jgi:hypothetical protein
MKILPLPERIRPHEFGSWPERVRHNDVDSFSQLQIVRIFIFSLNHDDFHSTIVEEKHAF